MLLALLQMPGCASKGNYSNDPATWTDDQVKEWFDRREWLGESRMQPDPSINKRALAIQYHLHKDWWDKAFAYMKKGDFSSFAPGNIPLIGDDVFVKASEYNSKDPGDAFYEVHRNHADIHFLVSGEEYIGHAGMTHAKVRTPYDSVKDIQFYEGAEGEQTTAKPGTFFIFFPGEAHRPGVKTGESSPVKKIVIKVRS